MLRPYPPAQPPRHSKKQEPPLTFGQRFGCDEEDPYYISEKKRKLMIEYIEFVEREFADESDANNDGSPRVSAWEVCAPQVHYPRRPGDDRSCSALCADGLPFSTIIAKRLQLIQHLVVLELVSGSEKLHRSRHHLLDRFFRFEEVTDGW